MDGCSMPSSSVRRPSLPHTHAHTHMQHAFGKEAGDFFLGCFAVWEGGGGWLVEDRG